MEAAAKRGRADGGDRLSALTDDLLHRVLSFLPAQQVVRTSVLSKRWRDLWRSVPSINLNWWSFPYEAGDEVRWRRIENFTTNLLMGHRAPRLDAFKLFICFIRVDWFQHVNRWISRAIEYLPSTLEISLVGGGYQHQLPYLGCSHLKRLYLGLVSLDYSFAQQLQSGLPVLEDLVLNQCRNEFDVIQSNTLKSLFLDSCWIPNADMFSVKTPCLTSLQLKFNISDKTAISVEAGNLLATAIISIVPGYFSHRYEAVLIGSLFNSTSLKLRGFSVMAFLDKELDKFPMFVNLRTLSLVIGRLNKRDVHKLQALGRFLHKCPTLENLTLDYFLYSRGFKWLEQKEYISRLKGARPVVGAIAFPVLKKLRTLILYGYDLCESDDFQLLRHCLRHSPNLEKLTVDCHKHPDDSTGGKGKTKSKKACSRFRIFPRFKCLKLKCTEIKYNDGDSVGDLVNFLVGVSGSAPRNIITLTMIEQTDDEDVTDSKEDMTDNEDDDVDDLPA